MLLRRVAFLIVSLVAITIAHAEPRTKESTTVRKAGNAKARVVGKLPANTVVTIDGEDGEWIRIRARVGKKQIVGFVAKVVIATDVAQPPTPAPVDDDDSEEGFSAPATKEPRKTIDSVVVRKKPGEKQAPVGTLSPGTVVQVEGEKGRWLRIRAGNVVGYVARTTITGPEIATDTTAIEKPPTPPPPAANEPPPRKWGRDRKQPQAAPDALAVEATVATSLRADSKADAAVVAEVARGARLVVVDASIVNGFIRVHDDQGHDGWITRAHVGNGTASSALDESRGKSVAVTSGGTTTATVESTPRPKANVPQRRLAVRVDAGIGYRVLGMDFTSNGAAGLANYVASADASAVNVDIDVTKPLSNRLVIGLDAQLGASRSSPGIDYPGPSGPPGEIPFSTVSVDAGIRAGFRARRMFVIAARAGAHYDAFVTSEVDNAGMLPRERLLGSTLGARVDVVPPDSRVSATLHVDALVLGDRRQTPGLEDGASSTARAVFAGVTARFSLGRRYAVHAAYDFGRATTEWSGMSVRDPSVTSARRVDSTQLVQVGLSVGL
jgi:SH3-like domain-containing protein